EKELTKFFEYMAYGIPIVCSAFPAWRAIVEANECGLTVNPDDPEDIARAVLALSSNAPLARRLGMNGSRAVQARYSWETQVDELIKAYRAVPSSREPTAR